MSAAQPEMKYSVYIALVLIAAIAMYDLTINNTVQETKEIIFGLLAFVGARQAVKSFLRK